METRTYTEKSNARRAAKAAGVNPDAVFETPDGFTFPAPQEELITDDTWPRHSNGQRKKIGELTHAQQIAVARGAVARLTPEFAEQGVKVEFKGPVDTALDIPAGLRLTTEQRAEAWAKNPPKASVVVPKEITVPKQAKAKAAKSERSSGGDKNATLLKMLASKGSTVEALTKALDWLPHTLRARISRLAKPKSKGGEGLKIERSRTDGVTSYRIAS